MPRKLMLDPSFWRDEKVGQCTYMERLLFEGLWTFADDNGVGRANPLLLKADIFPYDPLREADLKTGLAKLASLGMILTYEIDGQQYYYVLNFSKHQTINKPTPSTLPEPLPEHYGSATVVLPPEKKISKEEVNVKEEKRGGCTNPRPSEEIFAGRSFSREVRAELESWLKYKSERREDYKPTGLQKLLSQVENKLKEFSEEQIIFAISESMASNYQGIVWDKAARMKGGQNERNVRPHSGENAAGNSGENRWGTKTLKL